MIESREAVNGYRCTKYPAITYQIRGYEEGYGKYWADITIRDWNNGGAIDIQSDMGSFAYTWNDAGKPFYEFLLELEFDYFMGKAKGPGYKRFDAPATKRAILFDILKRRREGWGNKNTAREIWSRVRKLRDRLIDTPSEFFGVDDYDDVLIEQLYGGNFEYVPIRERPCDQCFNFWQYVWTHACEVWRKEVAESNLKGF